MRVLLRITPNTNIIKFFYSSLHSRLYFQADNAAGAPGILIGRYPGDTYAGGNPWQVDIIINKLFGLNIPTNCSS